MKLAGIIIALLLVTAAVVYYTPAPGPMRRIGYAEGLNHTKRLYHNQHWPSRSGPEVVAALDALLADLITKGQNASEEEKLACFRRADEALNRIYQNKRPIPRAEVDHLQSAGFMIASIAGLDQYRAAGSSPFTVTRE